VAAINQAASMILARLGTKPALRTKNLHLAVSMWERNLIYSLQNIKNISIELFLMFFLKGKQQRQESLKKLTRTKRLLMWLLTITSVPPTSTKTATYLQSALLLNIQIQNIE